MVWEQLSINKPHLVYLILGGFTSLFMLCSSVIKEKLYIGEATVATLCGIIFGPHAANLIDPASWGNVDQITLEFARIVLVVQCFAVGVELPKAYMERHWRSVAFFLIPVMTFGYLVTSLFVWGLIPSVNWLDSLVIAACVTATDPVLASSVVGKGKFAKRVPKHIRDVLSAESGCNDGMAFPFVYLGLYIIKYRDHPSEVAFHWICFTILYECIFGAFYGFVVGYLARRGIRYAHDKGYIDRESFLVFYFVLALFCAGSGSLLGMDDLLIGFACGVGFSNDGWFTEKTEESHVSNVIDLLINLAFFVYFGTIIPWEQFNSEDILGLSAWRLAVLGILVLLFRRIPIMLALKPLIPDVKTWREAFFCGHFGPIGVGALFVAILARAELETGETTPLAELPPAGFPHLNVIELIWPVTCFLVICSIIVHGSSIAVFTLGKHINTLTLTMSYTQANDSSWMERLPRIQSRSKSSMSLNRGDYGNQSFNEKLDFPAGVVPKNFLRRQREEDTPSRASSRGPLRRKKNSSCGGPISQSAIAPLRSPLESSEPPSMMRSDSDTLAMKSEDSPDSVQKTGESTPTSDEAANQGGEIFEEGGDTVYENKDGDVLEVEHEDPNDTDAKREQHERKEANRLAKVESNHGRGQEKSGASDLPANPSPGVQEKNTPAANRWRKGLHMANITKNLRHKGEASEKKPGEKRGAARAYQYGNTIIVEDEDGEVIKKYNIGPPAPKKKDGPQAGFADPQRTRQRMYRMTSYLGVNRGQAAGQSADEGQEETTEGANKKGKKRNDAEEDDDNIRFTMEAGGRRMSKAEFIAKIQEMDPKSRARAVEASSVPEAVKEEAREDAREHARNAEEVGLHVPSVSPHRAMAGSTKSSAASTVETEEGRPEIRRVNTGEEASGGPDGLTLTTSRHGDVPFHSITGDLQRHSFVNSSGSETAAQKRRREAAEREANAADEDSEDDGTERVPPPRPGLGVLGKMRLGSDTEEETAAERRRREGALGIRHDEGRDSESDDEREGRKGRSGSGQRIRFATDGDGGSTSSVPQETAANRRRREAMLAATREEEEEDDEEVKSASVRFAEPARSNSGTGDIGGAAGRRVRFGGGGTGGTGRFAAGKDKE